MAVEPLAERTQRIVHEDRASLPRGLRLAVATTRGVASTQVSARNPSVGMGGDGNPQHKLGTFQYKSTHPRRAARWGQRARSGSRQG